MKFLLLSHMDWSNRNQGLMFAGLIGFSVLALMVAA